jgi:hypothetical protein
LDISHIQKILPSTLDPKFFNQEDSILPLTTAEIYLRSIIEVEGRQLSEQSKGIIKSLASDNRIYLAYLVSDALANQGIDSKAFPEVWDSIA